VSGTALDFSLALAEPPARVFAALTEARHLARWFCDEAESEPRAGGALVMRWTRPGGSPQPFVARWLEWSPPAFASFTGGHSGYPGGSAGTVRYTLEPAPGGGTRLAVSHETPADPGGEPFVAAWRGAWPRALDRLAHYLAPGAADAGA
jgi:uncharacterized protein YndB with AHSA1/START domain